MVYLFDLDDTLYSELDFLKSAYKEIATCLTRTIGPTEEGKPCLPHCTSPFRPCPRGDVQRTEGRERETEGELYFFMLDCYSKGENAFARVIEQYAPEVTIEQLLDIYRNHKPDIHLSESAVNTLDALHKQGNVLALLTDGRSVTQRNKIEALGLERWMADEDIIISEEFGHGKPDQECYQYFMDRYPGEKFVVVGDNVTKDFITPNKLGWTTICLIDSGSNIHKQDFTLPAIYLPKHCITTLKGLISASEL